MAIAVAFTVASFFARVSVRRWNWLLGGGLYLAAGVLLLLVRGVVGLWIAAEERVRPKGANAPAAEGELGDRSAANGQTSP